MKALILFPLALPLTCHAITITGGSNNWMSPFLFEVTEGSNIIDNTLPGGNQAPLFYTMRVPSGLEITRLNVLSYSASGSGNGGSLLAMQIGRTLEASPAQLEADFRFRVNNILISQALIGSDDVLQTLNAGEQLQGAPTLVARDYALFFNENTPGISGVNFQVEFIATPVPEPSALTLLALASSLGLRRRRP